MKERPILCNDHDVRAIVAGSKTMMRRVVKIPPAIHEPGDNDATNIAWLPEHESGPGFYGWMTEYADEGSCLLHCPYGQPGDLLWVRETWAHYHTVNGLRKPDGRYLDDVSDGLAGYRADGHDTIEDFREHVRLMSGCDLQAVVINGDRWRPSIHMPRWASRITLEIVSVRVERLQAISEADAIAEGCVTEEVVSGYDGSLIRVPSEIPHPKGGLQGWDCARDWYADLWESINGTGSWDTNPWVWVVEFRRVK